MNTTFTKYLKGIGLLKEKLDKYSDDYPLISILQMRLKENIDKARMVGDSPENSASRMTILVELNEITQRLFDYGFDEFCQSHLINNFISKSISTHLTIELRHSLVEILLKITVTRSYHGRSALLAGIPNIPSLMRPDSIARQDLEGIVDQLDKLGQLSSGEWPLLIFIDNAMQYVRGFALEKDLHVIRQTLVQRYGV